MEKSQEEMSDALKGWQQIAGFLGQPVSVSQRWARVGMPVERKGRFVYASREKLQDWLHGEAAGDPVQIATEDTDLRAELQRGLSHARKTHHRKPGRAA